MKDMKIMKNIKDLNEQPLMNLNTLMVKNNHEGDEDHEEH